MENALAGLAEKSCVDEFFKFFHLCYFFIVKSFKNFQHLWTWCLTV